MSSQPPPVPRQRDYGWSWRDWLPWALFGITLAALIGVGVWQGIRISNLEDDKSALEAQLAGEQQANQTVSAQAKKAAQNRPIFRELASKGIYVRSESKATVAEEIPEAYKDVADVVEVMHGSGVATKVAKLVPLAVIKG